MKISASTFSLILIFCCILQNANAMLLPYHVKGNISCFDPAQKQFVPQPLDGSSTIELHDLQHNEGDATIASEPILFGGTFNLAGMMDDTPNLPSPYLKVTACSTTRVICLYRFVDDQLLDLNLDGSGTGTETATNNGNNADGGIVHPVEGTREYFSKCYADFWMK